MGDKSQSSFLEQSLAQLGELPEHGSKGKALITGAALEGHSLDIYNILRRSGYAVYTSDIATGEGVDIIWDLQNPPADTLQNHFDLVVSCSVLEHVPDVESAARNLTLSTKSRGLLYTSLPWVWRYHRYPDDFHRFHASTTDRLFEKTKVIARAWSTSPDCKLYPFKPNFDQELSQVINGIKYLPYLMLHELRVKL